MKVQICVVQGDITKIPVDVIVNAANEAMRGGGGVDGAIHKAAGPKLLQACKEYKYCEPGGVRLTPAFKLPAKWVLHTVGPRYSPGSRLKSARILRSCYQSCLTVAAALEAKSISFPMIATGIFGYPAPEASRVAIKAIDDFLIRGLLTV